MSEEDTHSVAASMKIMVTYTGGTPDGGRYADVDVETDVTVSTTMDDEDARQILTQALRQWTEQLESWDPEAEDDDGEG